MSKILAGGVAVNQTAGVLRASRLVLLSAACVAVWGSAAAQYPDTVVIKGEITAVRPPDGFDVAGHHVMISTDTEFVSFYHIKKNAAQLRRELEVGMYVQLVGTKDHSKPDITATEITMHDDDGRKVSGTGVIVRVIATKPETVVRADGYTLRVEPGTELRFNGGLTKLDELGTNNWVHYEGRLNDKGEVGLSYAAFAGLKLQKQKRDPKLVEQVTTFPPGSLIDFDGGFRTDRDKHRMEDAGAACGWHPVVEDDALQARVRRLGTSLIPPYQHELADDDPTKIPFRFYVVVTKGQRTDLDCEEGLVLIPMEVVDRLQNDSQLAAVLADGVAENLQRQKARYAAGLALLGVTKAASYVTLSLTGAIATNSISHSVERRLEDDSGRVALGLMADAGYDPWQAPVAWRLLAPAHLPSNLAKLKDPPRSVYLTEILGLQYKPGAADARAPASAGQPGSQH